MKHEERNGLADVGGERPPVGPWSTLEGGRGTALAVSGEYTAAAQLASLTVWAGARVEARVDAPSQSPGRPQFVLPFVFWGEGALDLGTGIYARLHGVYEALVRGTDAPSFAAPGRSYLPACYAWSNAGDALVVSAAWGGASPRLPSRAVLLDGSGEYRATLWAAEDLAPGAAWLGRRAVVLGTREPLVFARDGRHVATLSQGLPAKRIESSADETRLMIVEDRRITVWETATWELHGEWPGLWLDAALAPDGRGLAAVGFDGRVHYAHVAGGLTPAGELDAPAPVVAVAHGTYRIAAAFAGRAAVRTAPLTGKL